MVLAHRERTSPRPTQRDLSIRRMTGGRPAPLPGPGTYARHNAVDMPAMLPDGSAARLSVSAVMGVRAVSGITIAGLDELAVPQAPALGETPAAGDTGDTGDTSGPAAGTGGQEER